MCRALEVSRSGYYAFKARPKGQNRLNNDKLLIEIRRVFWDNNRNYGSPRIWDQLRNKEQIPCSLNRVARLMSCNNIVAIQRRKFRMTTNSKHNYSVWPNVLDRNFNVSKPNIAWVTDITYIWTYEGWLYLAAILDFFQEASLDLLWIKQLPIH